MVVLNRNHPRAVLIGLEQGGLLSTPGGAPAIHLTSAEANSDLDTLEQLLQSPSPAPERWAVPIN